MDNNIFNEIGTTLDLNGPILSFSEQPTGTTGIGTTAGATGGASVSFTGIATGVDPGTGYLSYQWYEENVGILEDSTYVTGTASTGPVGTAATLTISNLITPRDNQRKFYVTADYVPSAYGVGRSTGNAWNEPLTSGIATATVTPLIEIVAQPPSGVEALLNNNISINVNADLTDSYFTNDLQYQWYLNGEIAVDGVKTVTTTTGSTESGSVEETFGTGQNSHIFPAVGVEDLEIIVGGASGGAGGSDAGGPGGGGSGAKVGKFSLPGPGFAGTRITAYGANKGNGGTSGGHNAYGAGGINGSPNNNGAGGRGGGAGNSGWSGGGGGGGAASYLYDNTGTFIVAAGGGGGGGGSHNRGGEHGRNPQTFTGFEGDVPVSSGDLGATKYGDGGGGGGGGGGSLIGNDGTCGEGGYQGQDNSEGGEGGWGGCSRYDQNRATLLQEWVSPDDATGYINIKYTGYTSNTVTTVTNTTIAGAQSETLTIQSDSVGVQTCQCKISSATASNSPIWSDVVTFVATSDAENYFVDIEAIGVTNSASLSIANLGNGDYTFYTTTSDVASEGVTNYYSFYSSGKDLDIEMDLYGGRGSDSGSYTGGEGGYSRIRFTMDQDTEYVLTGLTPDINAPFLYRKAQLMACVGGGGNAGPGGHGGDGGGVGVDGEDGQGRDNGAGGITFATGTLGENGVFGTAFTAPTLLYPGDTVATGTAAGRTIRCTKGVYWAQQGNSACEDISGETTFRLPDGTVVTNTANIARGFKAGYNIMQTAGNGNGGDGGNGAHGGRGSSGGSAGGGGGSGYNGGDITVIDTQRSGSTGDAKVVIRIAT